MALETTSSINFPIDFEFDDSDIIIISNNGLEYEITWKALKMSQMIKDSFENIFFLDIQIVLGVNTFHDFTINLEQTETGLKKTVTLIGETYNYVDGPVFKIIIDMIKYYAENDKFPDTSFKDIHDISLVMLFEVYKASNFLNIQELFDGCASYIASLIRNKTKEQIEELFAQTTPEEETDEAAAPDAPVIASEEAPVIASEEAPVIASEEAPVIASEEVPIIVPVDEAPIIVPVDQAPIIVPVDEAPIIMQVDEN